MSDTNAKETKKSIGLEEQIRSCRKDRNDARAIMLQSTNSFTKAQWKRIYRNYCYKLQDLRSKHGEIRHD